MNVMNRWIGGAGVALTLLLALSGSQARAQAPDPVTPSPVASPDSLSAEGDLRLLGQSGSWFDPGRGEEDYAFLGARLRARLRYRSPDLRALLEVQDVQVAGLPRGAVVSGPVGAMGVGGTYFAHSAPRGSINTAGLRQGFLEIGDPKGVQAQLGRFDYASATEATAGDPVLDSLLGTRLSQRMIGPFGYTEFSRSFDGLRLDVDGPVLHVTGLAARPTQGGFEPHFAVGMDRIFIGNLAATLKKSEVLPDSTGQVFWTRYDDSRQVPFVDNRPPAVRGTVAGQGGIHLDTFGLHFVSRLGRDGDALLWYAHQTGRWGTLTP